MSARPLKRSTEGVFFSFFGAQSPREFSNCQYLTEVRGPSGRGGESMAQQIVWREIFAPLSFKAMTGPLHGVHISMPTHQQRYHGRKSKRGEGAAGSAMTSVARGAGTTGAEGCGSSAAVASGGYLRRLRQGDAPRQSAGASSEQEPANPAQAATK